MALAPSFYSTGTATVAANGTAVTGQGTSWLNAVQPGDLFGTHKGIPIRIASVNSNTSLTLAFAWPGAAQAAAAYEIMLVPDASRVMETSRLLLEMLSDGDLAAIAALNSAADKLPYYTGVGAAALTDLKAKGRDIIAATDMLNLLGKLGPVNGGLTALSPSASGVGLSDGDFNTITVAGTYSLTGSWVNGFLSNGASAGYSGIMNVYVRGDQVYQYFLVNTSFAPQWFFRFSATGKTGTWPNPWWNMAGEVVGTVAQSSGRSIGAVIERGSNANGEYVRFADGTQICTFAAPGVDTTITSGPLFRSPDYSWTYPVAFAATPTWSVSVQASSRWGNCRQTSGTTVGTFNQYSTISSTSVLGWSLTAIGRWF